MREHLATFLGAYNFARRLKTLRGLTPYEAICKAFASDHAAFTREPVHLNAGTEHLAVKPQEIVHPRWG